jgi:hypothetical protein
MVKVRMEASAGRSGLLLAALWNADNAASDSAVPVVLKRQPPPTINDA